MKKMKKLKKLLLIIALPLLLAACGKPYGQNIEIKNIKTKETVILNKKSSKGNIYGIRIKISGQIEGESKISLIQNNKEYKTNKLKDNFSFIWNCDWYSDSAKIIYEPVNAKNGKVFIEYKFKDM
ncbi:hypothetical protein [Hydrogenimonas urashimensis]|uniref:hypothetical protein n=1 Tax=Hydrogenimonas urashimensis TaxID=2740515 RepID=UPI00191585CB|nr:hypothetical protein [Hydrogenimonas urashimensis]